MRNYDGLEECNYSLMVAQPFGRLERKEDYTIGKGMLFEYITIE
jgi:hypothetical protein